MFIITILKWNFYSLSSPSSPSRSLATVPSFMQKSMMMVHAPSLTHRLPRHLKVRTSWVLGSMATVKTKDQELVSSGTVMLLRLVSRVGPTIRAQALQLWTSSSWNTVHAKNLVQTCLLLSLTLAELTKQWAHCLPSSIILII